MPPLQPGVVAEAVNLHVLPMSLLMEDWFTSVTSTNMVIASGNHSLGTVKANRGGRLFINIEYIIIMIL